MNITLKQRKLPSGKISLHIEYYKGFEVSLEGKKRHIREFENLKLFRMHPSKCMFHNIM
ncbi:hypothetical protein HMPREF9714_01456 [Myroides odoratimimus CCUG 12901]|nr:hypothetical protein HMPREF9714_01456 [Myroides odoratimimus CCUG 12901]